MTIANDSRKPTTTTRPLPPAGRSENTYQSMTIYRRVVQAGKRYLRCSLACWGSSFSLCYTPRQLAGFRNSSGVFPPTQTPQDEMGIKHDPRM